MTIILAFLSSLLNATLGIIFTALHRGSGAREAGQLPCAQKGRASQQACPRTKARFSHRLLRQGRWGVQREEPKGYKGFWSQLMAKVGPKALGQPRTNWD